MADTPPEDKSELAKEAGNPDLKASRALFDFSVLIILIYLFLAVVNPHKRVYHIFMSLPYVIVAIQAKRGSKLLYPLGLAAAVIPLSIGFFNGDYLISLGEWGMFLQKGSSLRFFELADAVLLLGFAGMGYYSIKRIFR
ncbi:MAG: hypothetical protein IH880_04015 [Candidatus Marinimicrobia bacterium]|nr:hypothetical protein [Candidatus Neomarinimicrobiota bacterium]